MSQNENLVQPADSHCDTIENTEAKSSVSNDLIIETIEQNTQETTESETVESNKSTLNCGTEQNEKELVDDRTFSSSVDLKENTVSKNDLMKVLQEIDELDENSLILRLKNASKEDLEKVLFDIEHHNHYLSKENDIYEFILNEDETIQDTLESMEVDEDQFEQEPFIFSYPIKCYFAKLKIDQIKKDFDLENSLCDNEIQILKFKLELLNSSLRDLKEFKEKFDREIKIGGKHPVTKKVILQKVAKHFDDTIQNKMAMANRYKIQAQSDVMERNKILSQIKAQEKRLASLDITEYQKTQFEHTKSCRQLAMYKEQLGKFKMKFSPLLQSITEMKKALNREEIEMERMKNAVSKLEHLKEVMLCQKARNDQKVIELKSEMRKIKLDPRRHNLPEVIDYAAAKKENATIKKEIQKWKRKVHQAQQEKFLYLSALSKKNL